MRHPSVLPDVSVTMLVPTVNDPHVAMQFATSGYCAFVPVQLAWIWLQ
jgi:hypothetical protein